MKSFKYYAFLYDIKANIDILSLIIALDTSIIYNYIFIESTISYIFEFL